MHNIGQLAETYLSMLDIHDPDLVDRYVATEYRNHDGFVAGGRRGEPSVLDHLLRRSA